jgi:hypothetical protein
MVLHAKQAATAMCVYAQHSTVEQTVRFVSDLNFLRIIYFYLQPKILTFETRFECMF